jgi:anti-anti-sigma factor
MSAEPFTVTLEEADGAAVVRAEGDFDYPDACELSDALELLLETGPAALVFDLSRVSFIGSYGLSTLLAAVARARAAGLEPDLMLSADGRRLFEVTAIPLVPARAGDGRLRTIAVAGAGADGVRRRDGTL